MSRIFSEYSLGTTANANNLFGQLEQKPSLEGRMVEALELAVVSTASELASIIDVEINETFHEALAGLVSNGFIVRHKTPDAPVYVISNVDAATRLSDSLRDDVEILEDILGPPSWKYDSSTLEEFIRNVKSPQSDDALAWAMTIERGKEAFVLDGDLSCLPAQVRRLSYLTQHWPPDARKGLGGPLLIWAGLTASTQSDFSQERILALQPEARAVTVAGPGAGKTFTIEQRIHRLIEAGLSPTAISVIAYSRTAVAELLSRIPAIDGEIVDIRTLDSIAGQLVTHATEDIGETDYEGSVRQAATLIERDDRIARRWLDRLRHLIVDEAQDIVGSRREMLTALITALPDGCGITIFGDPAQAIYDYREREPGHGKLEALNKFLSLSRFDRYELQGNHRTSRPSLRRLTREGRNIVLESENGHVALSKMRELLYEISDGPPPAPAEARPVAQLALFRSHAAAAGHSARMGESGTRVRLADTNIRLAPAWLGRAMEMLQGHSPDSVDEVTRSDPTMPASNIVKEALSVALVDGRYDAKRMAQAVLVGQAPVIERPLGQIASTIHAAKGKEAQDVELHLPEPQDGLSEAEAAEEARVLYVGATRAKRYLYIAPEAGTMRVMKERHWRSTRSGVQVQLRPSDALGVRVISQPDGPIQAPLLRWRQEAGWGLFAQVNDEEVELAQFSEIFNREISSICASVRAAPFVPVARGHFWVDWCTTARDNRLEVVPVTDGFVWINFKRQEKT